MNQSQITCPNCKQPMHEGYFAKDARIAGWHEGWPKRLLGMPLVGGSKRRIPITAYRCPSCHIRLAVPKRK